MFQSKQHVSRDPSFSRIYLTPTNNCFQQLHTPQTDLRALSELRSRNNRLKSFRAPPRSNKNNSRPSTLNSSTTDICVPAELALRLSTSIMNPLTDEQIFAPPESSDDEESTSKIETAEKVLPTPASTQQSPPKRPLEMNNANARTSKRRKSERSKEIASAVPATQPPSQDFPDFLSQSSQRKKASKYGGKNFHIPTPSPPTPRKKNLPKNVDMPSSPARTHSSRSSQTKRKVEIPEGSPNKPASPIRLQLPEDFDDEDLDTEGDTGLYSVKNTAGLNLNMPRRRSGSTSSLSSVDSISSLQLDKTIKHRLSKDDDNVQARSDDVAGLPADCVRCPMCHRVISTDQLDATEGIKDLSKLTVRDQQKFCYSHRLRDARSIWSSAGYPKLDFDSLSRSEQVQKHIRNLERVIKRRAPSYYLTQVDNAITTAKGHQGKIKQFFDVTVLSIINLGYYGPKGARILSHAIANDHDIARLLSRSMRNDKIFKMAGLTRIINCVLLPELLTRLVREDMGIPGHEQAENEARKILEDSTEVGLMLCADDDHVEELDEEDQDQG